MIIIKYVIDSWAWVEYLSQSLNGEKIKLILDDEKNEIFINSIILSEVISKTAREKRDTNIAFKALTSLGRMADINDQQFSQEVGLLHARTREKIKDFGLADAFILVTARKLNAKLITGDIHFKGFKEAIIIE